MIEKVQCHPESHVKAVIAVMSGKGGVGKSTVTALLATALRERGLEVGIIDADLTGPSVPRLFGVTQKKVQGSQRGMEPVQTASGIDLVSINNIIEQEDHPVIWRAPLLNQTVKQFFTDVHWGEKDVLLIDMPPGTGDVPLTVMQSIPIDGMIFVTSPQDLVQLIVTKSVKMAQMLSVPILGFVENMSYFLCPDNGKRYELFGPSKTREAAKSVGKELLLEIPIDPEIAKLCDEGQVEMVTKCKFDLASEMTEGLVKKVEAMLE